MSIFKGTYVSDSASYGKSMEYIAKLEKTLETMEKVLPRFNEEYPMYAQLMHDAMMIQMSLAETYALLSLSERLGTIDENLFAISAR